jgi:hypothetical protein
VGKPLGLVSFAAEFQLSKVAMPLFRNGNSPDPDSVMWRAQSGDGSGGRVMQVLFCEPSLGKVGSGRPGTGRKVFLYYGTNF